MAIVYHQSLFSWKDLQDLGDLERLKLVIDSMPDGKLTNALSKIRQNGRNDHPIVPVWNSILAGIVYQHSSIESLRRELQRNAQLRELCGFDPVKGSFAVPSKSAYSRFFVNLLKHDQLISELLDNLVASLKELLPDFGKDLAFDSKSISSLSKQIGKGDQRGESDADWGKKIYKGVHKDGTAWEKVKSWFGFKLHLIVDANYELPVAMKLTKASISDVTEIPTMFEALAKKQPEIIQTCETGIGDKGYDDSKLIAELWDKYRIKPIIDIRNMTRDGEQTRMIQGSRYKNMTYDYQGTVFCHCPKTGEITKMVYGGFEEGRETLKYLCPAIQYGFTCAGTTECPLRKGVRISLSANRRVFTPTARSSYKWKRLYNKRSSVERVNSRIHTSFGFEKHYIRGHAKMQMRCCLSLCVMLAMACGRILQNKDELMRSLVKAA
jgi:hypothetical protein